MATVQSTDLYYIHMCLSLCLLHSWCVLLAATQEEADLPHRSHRESGQPGLGRALVISNEQGGGEDTAIVETGHHSQRNASRSCRPHQRHHEPAPRAAEQADPATPVEGAGPRATPLPRH